nr:MAG TPA: hypothetical protein [Bacteriophage sp.]
MGNKLWKIWRILFFGMVAEILGYLALFVVSMVIRIPHDIYMGIVIGLGAIYLLACLVPAFILLIINLRRK